MAAEGPSRACCSLARRAALSVALAGARDLRLMSSSEVAL